MSNGSALGNGALSFTKVTSHAEWPRLAPRAAVARFLHETMQPWQDELPDIEASFNYALSPERYAGGFVMLAEQGGQLAGVLVMLRTGMDGYVPPNLLLFVAVDPALRGMGVGRELIERSLAECEGAVKLHVDLGNPAARLYERMGFKHCYNEMRLKR